jgi:hypothetical protein
LVTVRTFSGWFGEEVLSALGSSSSSSTRVLDSVSSAWKSKGFGSTGCDSSSAFSGQVAVEQHHSLLEFETTGVVVCDSKVSQLFKRNRESQSKERFCRIQRRWLRMSLTS